MSNQTVRWMLGFYVRRSGRMHLQEPGFPEFEFWHRDRGACESEGRRVLRELRERGDTRDWLAYGHPDPIEVGAGRHPGGQWLQKLSDLP